MIGFLRQHPRAFGFSLLLHLLLIGVAAFSLDSPDAQRLVKKPGPQTQTIQTEIVDEKALEKSARNKAEIEQRRKQEQKRKAEAKRKKAEAEKKRKLEAEQKRKAELKRRQAEAEKKKKAEIARKKAEAEKKRKAEAARKKAEAEKKRKAEEARKKAEAEKKRKAEEARRKAEAEKKRKAEEARRKAEAERKRKAEEAARRKAEEEQRRKEAELQARLAAEERQRELDRMRNRYYAMIRDKISRNWRQPPNAGNKPECEVMVQQDPAGYIIDVTFGQCPGTREYRLSVEQAVFKSEPLPKPDDPELFEREIRLKFKPKD